jgi:hypothetical protein
MYALIQVDQSFYGDYQGPEVYVFNTREEAMNAYGHLCDQDILMEEYDDNAEAMYAQDSEWWIREVSTF